MDQDLAFREARIGWRGIAWLAAVSIGVYAGVYFGGLPAATALGGLTVGYLVARTTNI